MVEIKKETVITTMTSDGVPMEKGETYAYLTKDYYGYGVFNGLTKKGALSFILPLNQQIVNVMPASIDTIYRADLQIEAEPNVPQPENKEDT